MIYWNRKSHSIIDFKIIWISNPFIMNLPDKGYSWFSEEFVSLNHLAFKYFGLSVTNEEKLEHATG